MRNSKKKKKTVGSSYEVQRKVRVFIPEDLIIGIILRLPARSVGRFRSVSKSWLSITTNTSFIKTHMQHNRYAHQSLMIKFTEHKIPKRITFYLPSADTNIDTGITLRELPYMKLSDHNYLALYCDGLILFYHNPINRHYIINPLTCQSLLLPTFKSFYDIWGFYFHHSTSTYRIIASSNICMTDNVLLVVGKTDWRRIHDRRPAFKSHFYPLEVNESLHWLAWKNHKDKSLNKPPETIITFDKEAEVYGLLPLPPSEDLDGRGGNLMDFNGELGLWVINNYGIIDLWIMKECWIKRYSIKHPDLEGILRMLDISDAWRLGFAVSIIDEELLIGVKNLIRYRYLVRWNLKTGDCLVKKFYNIWTMHNIIFPYIESLIFFDHS